MILDRTLGSIRLTAYQPQQVQTRRSIRNRTRSGLLNDPSIHGFTPVTTNFNAIHNSSILRHDPRKLFTGMANEHLFGLPIIPELNATLRQQIPCRTARAFQVGVGAFQHSADIIPAEPTTKQHRSCTFGRTAPVVAVSQQVNGVLTVRESRSVSFC